jgi:hypothetical protein
MIEGVFFIPGVNYAICCKIGMEKCVIYEKLLISPPPAKTAQVRGRPASIDING